MIAAQVFFENVLLQARRNREGWGGCSPPRFLLKLTFYQLKIIVTKSGKKI